MVKLKRIFIIIIIIIIIIINIIDIIFVRFVVHSFHFLSLSLRSLVVSVCVRTHCRFSLVELVNEQTNKQRYMKEKNIEREKKKCCLDKNLKKKNVVDVAVASSCTHNT
jgi:hypothetical protein